jgi:mRNA interferase MazF
MIAIDQIRTVDKLRIIRVFENLTETEIAKCKEAIKETFID